LCTNFAESNSWSSFYHLEQRVLQENSEEIPGTSTHDLEINFLGTGSQKPSRTRNCTAIHLVHNSRTYLFDCAEATQHRVIRSGVNTHVSHIFISHLHGDHMLGLPGMILHLHSCMPPGGGKRGYIKVYGPPGLRNWLKHTLNLCSATTDVMLVYEFHQRTDSNPDELHPLNLYPNSDNYWNL
jgi:ribonuclease BN (tRNA processing enzyme)